MSRSLVAFALLACGSAGVQGRDVLIPQARPAVEGNRAPYDLVFSRDGRRAYVTEAAEGTVAEVDTQSGEVLRRLPTGGERPTALALTPDGKRLLVANSYSGSVAVLDLVSPGAPSLRPLPGMPQGVVVSPVGNRAYVAASQLDEVAVLDLSSFSMVGRIRVGRRPQALDLTPDGKTLVVGNLAGGSISVINTETLAEEARVPLRGVNLRGVAVTADGKEAFATLMPAFNGKPTDNPREVWHNLVQAVELDGADSSTSEDQWTDFARIPGSLEVFGSPDGHDVVLDRAGKNAWIAVAGRDVVTRITVRDLRRNTIWPFTQLETVTGANPRGLAMTPDGKQVWAANHLGNSLTVIDAESGSVLRTIDLGTASRVDPSIRGQYLFNNAGMTRSHRFTCNSCHPDGGTDGLTWQFVHVRDGMNRRNTRDLRGGVPETAPFRWSGHDAGLAEFVDAEVTGLLGGASPSAAETEALIAALRGFRLPPNPYRAPDGSLTEKAAQGKELFEGKAGCSGCHAGERRGGTGLREWVGTTPEGQRLDVPHLAGVYDSAPYLHDGRAATLEDVFGKHNRLQRHGAAHGLSSEELSALLRYLREL